MRPTPTKVTPLLIRRVIVAAREGAMQCPRCSYVLNYSDALLCRVGETHYCPRCWSKIPDANEGFAQANGGPHDAESRETTQPDDTPESALPEDQKQQ